MTDATAEYFRRKARTGHAADCSLADLGVQAIGRDAARQLLAELPEKHLKGQVELQHTHTQQFAAWRFQLSHGFSLCFYGYGSKQALLKDFADSCLGGGCCMGVQGLRRGVTARQVLLHAVAQFRHEPPASLKSRTDQQLLAAISECDPTPLSIVLLNIEGPGLRDWESQALLSELAALPNVNFVASFDDVNTPVLWDEATAGRFNWLYHNVTNYEPYSAELEQANVPSLLASGRVQATEISATEVLKSMPPKSRKIFAILVDQQQDKSGPGGIGFQKLYKLSRQKFLVSAHANLKGHLAEFRDHELLKEKRGEDGAELLYVPLPDDALASVLKEIQAAA